MVRRGISPTLGMPVVQYDEKGYLVTHDGVTYTKAEVMALRGCHSELIAAVHRAKCILQGTVVSGPGGRA